MRRCQIVLDKKSDRLLKDLAADRDGNRSRVVREALQALADQEAMFDRIESDPGFIAMMERSEADFRAGRVIPHEEVMRKHLAMKKKKR